MVVIDKDIDILSSKALEMIMQEKPDVVYYLAGPMELRGGAGEAELQSWQEKYSGLGPVLAVIVNMQAKLVLVSSGGAVYSNPDSAYAKANIFLEGLVEYSGADYVILRLSNIYGPGQWKDGLMPSVILHILQDRTVVIGGDGNQTRDFLYVADAVSALIQAGTSQEQGIFDVGSGRETAVNEVLAEVEAVLGKEAKKEYRGSAGPQKSVVNPEKFQQTFGWQSKIGLKEGLLSTIEYYQNAKS